MRLLVILAPLVLSGCATTHITATPEPPPTLAALETLLRGETVTLVLLNETEISDARLDALGPDSTRLLVDSASVSVATAEVDEVRYLSANHRTRRRQCIQHGAAPGVLTMALIAVTAGSDDETAGFWPIFLAMGACTAAGGAGFGALIGPSLAPTQTIPIAPLSQYADAPRGGVGIRP